MQTLDKALIIKHGRYYWSAALSAALACFGVFAFVVGIKQVLDSDFGVFSLSGVFALIVMSVVLYIFGYKMGFLVLRDMLTVVGRIKGDKFHIVQSEIVTKGGCTTCAGADNGTGIMFSDGSAFVDNTGRRVDYDFGDKVYLVYVGEERYPIDVFKVDEYEVASGIQVSVHVPEDDE